MGGGDLPALLVEQAEAMVATRRSAISMANLVVFGGSPAWSRSGESRRNPGPARIRVPAFAMLARMSGYCDIAPDAGRPLPRPRVRFPAARRARAVRAPAAGDQPGRPELETILRKRYGFRRAYDGFDVDTVAGYGAADCTRLLADAGIIRNRLKVDAAIHNAQVIRGLRDTHGDFAQWLDVHAREAGRPRDKVSWVKLFKRTFEFTGGEITGEFLMSLGYWPGAHRAGCPALKRIAAARKALSAG